MTNRRCHPAALPEEDLLAECGVRRQRRSGPGGQHRNKVETAIVVTHRPTGAQGSAAEGRSQEQNRQRALFRLRLKLAITQRHPVDPQAYQPSERWLGRCGGGRMLINPEHDDFPALLAEALDVLATVNWEPTAAAALLHCSSSQLIKLLQREPQALVALNQERLARGLHPLR